MGGVGRQLKAAAIHPPLSCPPAGLLTHHHHHTLTPPKNAKSNQQDGKYLRKRNTFTDFIACAEHLVACKVRVHVLGGGGGTGTCVGGSSGGGPGSPRFSGAQRPPHPLPPTPHPPTTRTQYTSPSRLCIEGRSAGGLTMGAVLNLRPDLFSAAILGARRAGTAGRGRPGGGGGAREMKKDSPGWC